MSQVLDDRALAVLHERDTELGQVVALLAAAGHDPEGMPVGAGDRLLLELCCDLTGRELDVTVTCPACGTASTATLTPEALPSGRPRCAMCGTGGGLREPTYGDLTGLPADVGEAAAELLRRCTVGSPTRAASAEDLDLIDDSLCGPMLVACSGCGAAVESPADVQRLVLASLAEALDELDAEVHVLAGVYRWSLGEIEAQSRRRRRLAQLAGHEG